MTDRAYEPTEDTDGLTESHAPVGRDGDPEMLGPYRILETLGEGGFGIVHLAQQTEPVRRKVALKIIKRGMDSKQIIARFEAEKQALALMNHPGVAKVLDGGTTDDGRPYFVMEHVPGMEITEYCDRNKLSIAERLELFVQSCEAVQHAHQKGVIHRDIKPSNILVMQTDAGPVPKVIDFGIAKALGAHLTEDTIYTEHGQVIGTPAYMSPEQAGGTARDIDTRADVYSLGVLLYELLIGQRPLDLGGIGFMEVQRRIQEIDPPRPSTRLSQIADGSTHAERRRTDARSMRRKIRGDLDWIVMKCLEKDRSRRYETASALAEDVRRHLSDEPVLAGPPSATYRVGKFVRRHRVAVAAAVIVVLVLIGGIAGTTWGLVSAIEARDAEATAKQAAQDNLKLATEQAREALLQAQIAAEARDAADLAKDLAEEREEEARTQAQLAAEARDAEAVAKIEAQRRADELAQVVEFQARQLGGIDVSLMGARLRADLLAETRSALDRTALEPAYAIEQMRQLEVIIGSTSFTDIALDALESNIFANALVAVDEQFGEQPLVQARLLQTIASTMLQIGLLDAAVEPQDRAVEIRRRLLGEDDPATLESIAAKGLLLRDQGRFSEAEAHYRAAVAGAREVLGDEHQQTLDVISGLSQLLEIEGRLDESEPLALEALEGRARVLGDEHPDTLVAQNSYGVLLFKQGRLAEAEPHVRGSRAGFRRVLGDEHPSTITATSNLADLAYAMGNMTECEQHYRDALRGYRQAFGNEHPATLRAISNVGLALQELGKLEEAGRHIRESLDTSRRVLGRDHPDTLVAVANMGVLLWRQGKLEEAEQYFREDLDASRRVLGDDHPDTLTSVANLGTLLQVSGRLEEAEPYFVEALEGRRRVLGDEHPRTLMSMRATGILLSTQGKHTEAEPYLRGALEICLRTLGEAHPDTLASTTNMARLLNLTDRHDEARRLISDRLPAYEEVFGSEHWLTASARGVLGEALVALERYEEAEAVLLQAHAGVETAPPGPRKGELATVRGSLVRLYDAWGRPGQAASWRVKLEAEREGS